MKMLRGLYLVTCTLILFTFMAPDTMAQSASQPLGIVLKAAAAHIGNAAAADGATVYSGDYLSTGDNGAIQIRIGTLSLELQANSSAHIYRAPYGAIAELNSGTLIYTTPGERDNLVIVASDVRVTPVLSTPDFGRVSIDDPCKVSIYSQRGQASVQVGSETKIVEQGKAYRVAAENSISYREYLSPDENDYHNHHEHKPCAAIQTVKGHSPIAPGQSRFLYLAAGTVTVITLIPVLESFESPNRP